MMIILCLDTLSKKINSKVFFEIQSSSRPKKYDPYIMKGCETSEIKYKTTVVFKHVQ